MTTTRKQPFVIIENGSRRTYESREDWLRNSPNGTVPMAKAYLDTQILTNNARFLNREDHDKFWSRKRLAADLAFTSSVIAKAD